MKPPTEPEVFLKGIGSLTGPFDPISRGPNKGVKLDWETELTVVIGREAKDITTAEAPAHIFGYVCLNDVSDRATQVDADGQQHLVRAKSRPTYCPIGPYLTTGVDGMNLNMWTKLNGQLEQQGNTNDMLFNVYEVVAYFSTHMVLYPGDLLATGTPPGVGFGKNRFMAVGDVLECGIEHRRSAARDPGISVGLAYSAGSVGYDQSVVEGASVARPTLARRYPAKPRPANPTSIIAQVEGSGTVGLYSTQPGLPSSTFCNRSNASVK